MKPKFPKGIIVNPDIPITGLPLKKMIPFYIGAAIVMAAWIYMSLVKMRLL